MRYKKLIFLLFVFMFLFSVATLFGAPGITLESPAGGNLTYNRFLVADLGLLGEGKSNNIFVVKFNEDSTTDEFYLHITVTNSDGVNLLDGDTEKWPYNEKFSGKVYTNHNITDAKNLGGSFNISDESKKLQDMILATGTLPQDSYSILIELKSGADDSVVDSVNITVNIIPPVLQPIFPVNNTVTPSGLVFRWRSNLNNLKFHIFEDPRGTREIISGTRLPSSVSGSTYNGSGIVSLLDFEKTYYWQLSGYINTSHGSELVKSPLNAFILRPEGSSAADFGLSDEELSQIKAKLIKVLKARIGKRAANSIKSYDLKRIILDNGEVSMDDVMNILEMIERGELKVNRATFR